MLVAEAGQRVERIAATRGALETQAAGSPVPMSFADALRGTSVAVIAEIKRQSPSKGVLNSGIRAGDRAVAYARGGAAAISVLTEPSMFGGSLDDLRDVAGTSGIPALRKDFIVDELQILESRAAGASGVLLIARALHPSRLTLLVEAARAARIEPLVEVRSRDELSLALDAGATVVGINARDLETLAVDPALVEDLVGLVPGGILAVAESGLTDRSAVERVAAAGADAVLVGSALSLANDAAQAVAAIAGVSRVDRGRPA